jgi:hypothetical protein
MPVCKAEKFKLGHYLLADVVEQVIPRTHPLFNAVLLETAILKVSQEHEQPEDESFLGEDW